MVLSDITLDRTVYEDLLELRGPFLAFLGFYLVSESFMRGSKGGPGSRTQVVLRNTLLQMFEGFFRESLFQQLLAMLEAFATGVQRSSRARIPFGFGDLVVNVTSPSGLLKQHVFRSRQVAHRPSSLADSVLLS